MPELPEVEILVRHLRPLVSGRVVRKVSIRRARIVRPFIPRTFARRIGGAKIETVERHLGMTGRMWVGGNGETLPKHTAAVLEFDDARLVFEDTRYFGRLSLDPACIGSLGPEPLETEFSVEYLVSALRGCRRAVKTKLLEQSLVAGVGNIYASEALHRAHIHPARTAGGLTLKEIRAVWRAIRMVLREAIRFGSTVPLSFTGTRGDGLFYYGSANGAGSYYEERLRVYDRDGLPCYSCGASIQRTVLGSRSTFHCPSCQPARSRKGGKRGRSA
jgi:formamidopyrimidine-DNA glycosylase